MTILFSSSWQCWRRHVYMFVPNIPSLWRLKPSNNFRISILHLKIMNIEFWEHREACLHDKLLHISWVKFSMCLVNQFAWSEVIPTLESPGRHIANSQGNKGKYYWIAISCSVRLSWHCFRPNQESEKVFSLTSIVQINVVENLGILIFRTEKCGKYPSQVEIFSRNTEIISHLQVWVYRLSGIEDAQQAPGRDELKEHAFDSSKGILNNHKIFFLQRSLIIFDVHGWQF